jgi:predicted transcriptional regulator
MEKETTPSQSEWLIMEVFWANDTPSMTAKEVISKIKDKSDMSPRMVRVLLNRLWQKGVLSYTVDEHDLRVYHYSVQKSKEECQKEKSRKFVDSYFEGSRKNAMAALLQSADLTEEQFRKLEEILEQCREKEHQNHDGTGILG